MSSFYQQRGKRILDVLVSTLFLLLLWPFLLVLSIAIRLDSEGSILFSQKRLGKDGKVFLLYKFRTMVKNAEELKKDFLHFNEADGPVFKMKNDPRFTRVGRFLAQTGLDELPQFINVLQGNMSFVGPRPLPVDEASKISSQILRTRKTILPGMTSSWVISGSHHLSFDEWMRLDLSYSHSIQLSNDLRILWKTFLIVMGVAYKSFLMKLRSVLRNQHLLELLPLLFISSLLPFLYGGESLIAEVVFLAFPLMYAPILFWRRRKVGFHFRPVFWAWVGLLFFTLVSTVTSISLTLSLPSFFLLLGVFLYFLICYIVFERESDLQLLSYSIVLVGFILSLVSCYLIFAPSRPIPSMNLVYARYGHNHLAGYLLFVIPIVAVRFMSSKTRRSKIFLTLLLLFLFFNFYLTFARAASLVLLCVVLLLIVLYKPGFSQTVFLTILGIVPLVTILFSVFFFPNRDVVGFQSSIPKMRDSWLLRQVVKPLNSEPRPYYLNQSLSGFMSHPLVGTGLDTFQLTSRRYQEKINIVSKFTHNSLFQLLSETGLGGLITFVLLFIFCLRNIHVSKQESSYRMPLFIGALSSFAQSLFDINFNFLALFLLFWIIMASLLRRSETSFFSMSTTFIPPFFITISFFCFLFVLSTFLSSLFSFLSNNTRPFSENRVFLYHEIAAFLPTLSVKKFDPLLRYLKDHPDYYTHDLKRWIIVWNREDPSVYSQLASVTPDTEVLEALVVYDSTNSIGSLKKLFLLSVEQNDFQSAVGYLDQAAEVSFVHLASAYPGLIPSLSPSVDLPRDNPQLNQDYADYLKTVRFGFSVGPFSPELSVVFYNLGLISFRHSETRLAEELWRISVPLAPEWSYFHVELINFYLRSERDAEAQAADNFCSRFTYPESHCREFYADSRKNGSQEIGFLKATIDQLLPPSSD